MGVFWAKGECESSSLDDLCAATGISRSSLYAAFGDTYGPWLQRSMLPKLFINGDPGRLINDRARDFCRTWSNQREITVKGRHFLQEDSADEIGLALSRFVQELRQIRP
jgi:haloalkane dehalogenase